MDYTQDITITAPIELEFDCERINKAQTKCSQAFPDLIRHQDRLYLTFRTAPSHFPSGKARIRIFSSIDGKEWQPEHSFNHIMDLRDPHFLQFKGKLYLFYMSHSRQLVQHEPENIYVVEKTTEGWSQPRAINVSRAGFWNIRTHENKAYMSIYTSNGSDNKHTNSHFKLITSSDLVHWQDVFSSPITRKKLGSYQTSEAAFDFDQQGNIIGTIRSLIYPNLNFKIMNDGRQNWKLNVDRFKCDGPNLFRHNDSYFLVARRSLFHRLPSQPFRIFRNIRKAINILRYSFSRKRTALYQFDPESLSINHIRDLPSHGDTGYSAIAHLEDNRCLLIYYSSDIRTGEDLNWLSGQVNRTKLYSSIITIK